MSEEHLYPARPEYLRRGTPEAWVNESTGVETPGVMVSPTVSAMVEARATPDGLMHPSCGLPTHIDLRDVTARAHAAMAYTFIRRSGAWAEAVADGAVLDDPSIVVEDDSEPGGLALTPEARRMVGILCRMRVLDESVTVAEAREALGWAERVAGVSDERA